LRSRLRRDPGRARDRTPPYSRLKTSELLRALAQSAPERVSIAIIADALGDRRLGIVLLCLALPNAVPGPYIPGFSTILALPIIWLGLQLAFGKRRPRLPHVIRRVSFRRARFVAFVNRVAPLIARLERWLAPRPSRLTEAGGQRYLGLALIAFATVLAMPVPFGSVPVALGISVLALGLIEEDSRALRLGLLFGFLGCLWQAALVTFGIAIFGRLSSHL
jgi:hypothetical protein